jgi:hypothetical protein
MTDETLASQAAAGVKELAGIYVLPIARLAAAELIELARQLDAKNTVEARNIVRSKMTLEELTREKESLVNDLWRMADAQASAVSLFKDLGWAVMKLAFTLAVAL